MGSFYSDHPTWLHGLPAGAKLVFLALLGSGLYLTDRLPVLFISFMCCLLIFASLGRATFSSKPLLMGLVLVSVLIGLFHTYMQQPLLGLISILRLLSTTLMGIGLTLTTRYTDLLRVFEWLLTPLRRFGIKPERLSLQIALMLRFTEHFFTVWRRLDDAHRLRTGKSGGFKILAPLTIQMLVAARRVADALHVRFYR